MLLTSKYKVDFMHSNLNSKRYAATIYNMVNKIKYVAANRNKTLQTELHCGAIFYTLFTTPIWIYIGCNDIFLDNHHICEIKNRSEIKQEYTYKRPVFWCIRGSVIVHPNCLYVMHATVTHQTGIYQIGSDQLNRELRLYLSVWSLGSNGRNNVVMYDHEGNRKCLTTDAFTYQRIKLWVIRKPCLSMYYLVSKPYIISEQECKFSAHHTCNDRTCILNIYVCDGQFDCSDKSDEKNCNPSCMEHNNEKNQTKDAISSHQHCFIGCVIGRCICHYLYFQCATGACVPLDKICDDKQDCIDGLDETMCKRETVKSNERNVQLYLKSYNVSNATSMFCIHC